MRRGTRRHDIVEQGDVGRHAARAIHMECAAHVAAALGGVQAGLRRRGAHAVQQARAQRHPECAGERPRQFQRLVVAALAQAAAVQRQGGQGFGAFGVGQAGCHELRQQAPRGKVGVELQSRHQAVERRGIPERGDAPCLRRRTAQAGPARDMRDRRHADAGRTHLRRGRFAGRHGHRQPATDARLPIPWQCIGAGPAQVQSKVAGFAAEQASGAPDAAGQPGTEAVNRERGAQVDSLGHAFQTAAPALPCPSGNPHACRQ